MGTIGKAKEIEVNYLAPDIQHRILQKEKRFEM